MMPVIKLRSDLKILLDWIPRGSKVLDIGCGEGYLLYHLMHRLDIQGVGLEIHVEAVISCIRKGVQVIQGDADCDLCTYPDQAFDYVIGTHVIQQTNHPQKVLAEMARIGKKVVVSIPNFGYYKSRFKLAFQGVMPQHEPEKWYESPDIHHCTLKDFRAMILESKLKILDFYPLSSKGVRFKKFLPHAFFNLMAKEAIFILTA